MDKDRKEPGQYRDAYERGRQMAGFSESSKPQGWLIDEMKKAFDEERDSARNTKAEKLASYVIRHASEADVWAIRGKLDNLNHYKAKLFSARARGATDKIADYESRIESAQNELLENLADAVQKSAHARGALASCAACGTRPCDAWRRGEASPCRRGGCAAAAGPSLLSWRPP